MEQKAVIQKSQNILIKTIFSLSMFSASVGLIGCDDGGGGSPAPIYIPPSSSTSDPIYIPPSNSTPDPISNTPDTTPTPPPQNNGGGIELGGGGSPSLLLYPFENVYGDVCLAAEAAPGCTFSRSTGGRIDVYSDPHYDSQGYGTDDLWYVTFDTQGAASVYDDLGNLQYFADVSEFAGYMGGTRIGVGTTGLFWENVGGGTYWLGKNGVLYSGILDNVNYGQAINDKTSSGKTETSFASLNSDANKKLINKAAQKLQKNYGFTKQKSVAIASALNSWAVSAAERGKTTTKDMDKTFKAVFGVNFSDALSAVQDLRKGELSSVQDLTNRSAAALGLKPSQAQKFVKDMYKRALSQYGYNVDSLKW